MEVSQVKIPSLFPVVPPKARNNCRAAREKDKQPIMTRFSLGGDSDDGDEGLGPSSSRRSPKKLKTTAASNLSQPQSPAAAVPHIGCRVSQGLFEETEEDIDEEESEYEGEGETEDSDFEEEEDEDCDEELDGQQDGEDKEPIGDGSISVTLTDPDVLDCPICLESLSIPVFQCENGHVACSSCCLKIRNRCPSCSWPIGYNRCRAVEKILESVKISCRNMKYGCKEMVRYSDTHDHENSCNFAPCSCPLLDCNYVNSSLRLYEHFGTRHLSSAWPFVFNCLFTVCLEKNQKFLILQENTEGEIYMVNQFGEGLASAVNVICIGPTSSRREFPYEINVRDGGRTAIKLQSFVERIPAWVDVPPARNFLLVPSHCNRACGQLKLEICIMKPQ